MADEVICRYNPVTMHIVSHYNATVSSLYERVC